VETLSFEVGCTACTPVHTHTQGVHPGHEDELTRGRGTLDDGRGASNVNTKRAFARSRRPNGMSTFRQPFSRATYATASTATVGTTTNGGKKKAVHDALRVAIDTKKIQLEHIKPWIATRITEILNVEDEVLIGMIVVLLEETKVHANALHIREQLGTFLEKDTDDFMIELWELLISAQSNPSGIPMKFLEDKAREIERSNAAAEKMRQNQEEYASRRRRDDALGARFDERRHRPYDRRDRRSRSRSRERRRRDSKSPPPSRRERGREDSRSPPRRERERRSRWASNDGGDAPKSRRDDER